MSRTDLKNAIIGKDAVSRTLPKGSNQHRQGEVAEQLPLSIVVIADKGWHVGGISQYMSFTNFEELLCMILS